MVIESWYEHWRVPQDRDRNNLAGLFMNMFLLTSIADAVQTWNPDDDFDNLPKEEQIRLIRAGEASPLGTRRTAEEIEAILTSRPRRYPNTIEAMFDIRTPTPLEICLQLLTMLPDTWSIYSTNNLDVPYILSNEKGDFVSPVEIYDEETDDVEILFSTPVEKIVDGTVIYEIYDELWYRNADSKEDLKEMYPDIANYIERAFQPGAPVVQIIKEAKDSGAYDLAGLGEEVPLITSIMRIKSRNGADSILHSSQL